jgi:hypothetical protein
MRPELAERAFVDNKLFPFVMNIGECRRKITKTKTLKYFTMGNGLQNCRTTGTKCLDKIYIIYQNISKMFILYEIKLNA